MRFCPFLVFDLLAFGCLRLFIHARLCLLCLFVECEERP
jgi:hypothetical protein